jgi:hypothetical protein
VNSDEPVFLDVDDVIEIRTTQFERTFHIVSNHPFVDGKRAPGRPKCEDTGERSMFKYQRYP